MLRALLTALLLMVFSPPTHAEKRVALVVGNSAYVHTPKLLNPTNDTRDMGAALKNFGFAVVEGYDLSRVELEVKLREFARALAGSDVGLLYYAGHGLQVAGINYLVPIDAKLDDESALDFELVRLEIIQRLMERAARTNILFLDACRDNPLARNLARAMGTRSSAIGRGLANVEAGGGTLISFSTQPGAVAFDGEGRNSPFAEALVKHVASPDLDLGTILIRVRRDVMKETKNKQVPWEHSALTDVFFFGPAQTITLPETRARLSEAAEAWDRTKDTKSIVVLEAFVSRYGETFYGELARARLEGLRRQDQRVVVPGEWPAASQVSCEDQTTEKACRALSRCTWSPTPPAQIPIMDYNLYKLEMKRVSCRDRNN